MTREPDPLDDEALDALLLLAAVAVDAALHGADPPALSSELEVLQRGGGAFVTLRCAGELRGCIGTIADSPPLWSTVLEMARAAVLDDERFDRLKPAERDRIEIELSLLGELFPLAADAIEIGGHGLILDKGGRRALLLPQVAIEHGLDREGFLEALCQKAALPPGSWRQPDARLWGFRTQAVGGRLSKLLER
ncbi:MAG TPA: AmmeMemoRadiSam system protein A [Candidatus Krumholzibacteria bacterium]|jgi:AmmeMemoRadiSam system protein A